MVTSLDGVASSVVAEAPARLRRSRALVGLGVLAAVVAAGILYGVLRGPAPTGLAATDWEPKVILAVDPASSEWELRSLLHGGDVLPSHAGGPGIEPPYHEHRLSYVVDTGFARHSRSLDVRVFEVPHRTASTHVPGTPAPGHGDARHEPVVVRGHPATATIQTGGNPTAAVEWWEDDTTLVRVTLMGVPSLSGLAVGDELISPAVAEVVAIADALVEISLDDWLELDRQTQERRAAAAATSAVPPAAGPSTSWIDPGGSN